MARDRETPRTTTAVTEAESPALGPHQGTKRLDLGPTPVSGEAQLLRTDKDDLSCWSGRSSFRRIIVKAVFTVEAQPPREIGTYS